MSHHGHDANGWYIGLVDDDAPASTPIAPPTESTSTTPGEPRARWYRYEWRVEAFAPLGVVVPSTVSRRQARRALLDAQLLDLVDAAIENLEEPLRSQARIDWEDATEFERHNGTVTLLAPMLGLDATALDQLFIAAATY